MPGAWVFNIWGWEWELVYNIRAVLRWHIRESYHENFSKEILSKSLWWRSHRKEFWGCADHHKCLNVIEGQTLNAYQLYHIYFMFHLAPATPCNLSFKNLQMCLELLPTQDLLINPDCRWMGTWDRLWCASGLLVSVGWRGTGHRMQNGILIC